MNVKQQKEDKMRDLEKELDDWDGWPQSWIGKKLVGIVRLHELLRVS